MNSLILVDIQNDFLPGGALAVPNGHEVIPVANLLIAKKNKLFDLIVATQDWHPKNHGSFASNNPGKRVGDIGNLGGVDQVMWPDHCVQGTFGAELATALERRQLDYVVRKGTHPEIDSYSGFFDNGHKNETGLADYLKQSSISAVSVMGLATDYCVKYTALDAKDLGFDTSLVIDGSKAVNIHPDDEKRAIAELMQAGVNIVNSQELLK